MRRPGQHLAFARRAAHPRTGADRAYKYTARAGFADNFPDRYNHLLLKLDSMLRIVTSRQAREGVHAAKRLSRTKSRVVNAVQLDGTRLLV